MTIILRFYSYTKVLYYIIILQVASLSRQLYSKRSRLICSKNRIFLFIELTCSIFSIQSCDQVYTPCPVHVIASLHSVLLRFVVQRR